MAKAKSIMRRILRHHRFLLAISVALFLAVAVIISNVLSFEEHFTASRPTYSLSPDIAAYCQPLHVPFVGSEGSLHGDDCRIEAAFVVTRHGDRAPLYDFGIPLPRTCGVDSVDYALLSQYRHCLQQAVENSRDISAKAFAEFEFGPNSDDCRPSHLTPRGALQLIRLGQYLRNAYASIFELPSALPHGIASLVNASSTPYPRTYQSALALLYGLHHHHGEERSVSCLMQSVFVASYRDTYFGNPDGCFCHKVEEYRAKFYEDQSLHNKHLTVEVKQLLSKISRLSETSTLQELEATHALDLLLGGFMCRNAKLPCVTAESGNKDCIQTTDVENLYDWIIKRNENMRNAYSFKGLSIGEAYPLLHKIFRISTQLIAADDEDKTTGRQRFFIFSGHDITLRPLLRALEINEPRIPGYASRLVFELYRSVGTDKRLLRVLYNGVSVSAQVPFCTNWLNSEEVVCDLQSFGNFIGAQMLAGVSARVYCSDSSGGQGTVSYC